MSWRRFLHRRRWDDERRRELEAYLQIETDEFIARGLSPDEARAAACRLLGNPTLIREEIYQMNTLGRLDALWRDVRYSLRALRRTPAFALVAIGSLALGVGANTAIFQLLDAVRLRTLPVRDPQALVEVLVDNKGAGRTGDFVSSHPTMTNPLWQGIRDSQQVFSDALAWGTTSFDLSDGGESRPVRGAWVSGSFFTTLGLSPYRGRFFGVDDDHRGCGPVGAVVSYPFWQREFAGRDSALGQPIRLDGHAFEIAGITPPDFFGLEVGRALDVLLPICAEPAVRADQSVLDKTDVWWLGVLGRLKPGVTADQATRQLTAISPGLFRATLPSRYAPGDAQSYLRFTLHAVPAGTGVSDLRRTYETPLWVLLAIAGVVLLIACANLANLMLARASAREREMAVRLAIGASRARLVQQLLVESALLAAAGAAAGTAIATGLSRALVSLLSTKADSVFIDLRLDWRVLAFASATALLTCVVFGLVPALRATSTPVSVAMKSGGRSVTDSHARFGLRRLLVVSQIALSLVLIAGALLFVRTLRNLVTLDPGFRQTGVLIANFDLSRVQHRAGQLAIRWTDLADRLQTLPGVTAVAQTAVTPIGGGGMNDTLVIDGIVQKEYPNLNRVSGSFFRLMDIPLVSGRTFSATDTAEAPRVAVVNEAFVRTYLKGREPLASQFQFARAAGTPRIPYQIVGVVRNTKYGDLREPFGPIVFLADTQNPNPYPDFLAMIRSETIDRALTASVLRVARDIDPDILVTVFTLDGRVQESLARERLMATLSGAFAALAGVLAAIGLYGVMAYGVARRRAEIGIRIALGASRAGVVRLILREAALTVAAGLVIGLGLTIAAGRSAESLLFGLTAGDPTTIAAAGAALALVAACASVLPARRAARLNPTIALREE